MDFMLNFIHIRSIVANDVLEVKETVRINMRKFNPCHAWLVIDHLSSDLHLRPLILFVERNYEAANCFFRNSTVSREGKEAATNTEINYTVSMIGNLIDSKFSRDVKWDTMKASSSFRHNSFS